MTPDLYPRTAMLDIITKAMGLSGYDETHPRQVLDALIVEIMDHQAAAGWHIIGPDDLDALRRVIEWVHDLPRTIDPDGQPGRDLTRLTALIGDDA
jgi:hypothetical protein